MEPSARQMSIFRGLPASTALPGASVGEPEGGNLHRALSSLSPNHRTAPLP